MINAEDRRAGDTGAGAEPAQRDCTRRSSGVKCAGRERNRSAGAAGAPVTRWTAERIAALRRLIADSRRLTTRQIAGELGGVSRHAVIGMAGRLGLQLPNHGLRGPWRARVRHQAAKPAAGRRPRSLAGAPAAAGARLDRSGKPRAKYVAFLDLEPHHCRWPYGRRLPFAFCGRARIARSPYCAMHTKASRERVQTR